MDIKCLGGASEVGRMAILVDTEKEKFLIDYGINVQDMKIPIQPPKDIRGVFLSHAHLDHCGLVPELYRRGYSGSVYTNPLTFDLSYLLLYDSIKVQKKKGQEPFYNELDIEKMMDKSYNIHYTKPVNFKSATATIYDAGHVPGSSSVLIRSKKSVLYTGDINFIDTQLVRKADTSYKNIDVLLCESTYTEKNHPNREKIVKQIREKAKNVLDNNGTFLLPCFAIGRTQEMLLIMSDLGYPVYLDGMGAEVTRLILSNPENTNNYKKLKKAFGKARKIRKRNDRVSATKEPCIIITTAGMLNGGPIHFYLKKLHKRENCEMVLTGYQVEGTVGRTILDTGRYVFENVDVKPRMKIGFMDFSAHCGRDHLVNYIKKINPGKVLPVHGSRTAEFAEELKGMGFDSYAPKNGEKISV